MQEGRKVQTLASTLQTIIIALGILEAIAIFISIGKSGSYLVGFLTGMIVAATSAFLGWILNILVDAFGALVCSAARIEDMLAKTLGVDTSSASQSHISKLARATIAERNATPSKPLTKKTVCPFCKKVYPAETKFCEDCNAQIGS